MISILCPTRGRPDSVVRLVKSIQATAVGAVELILHVDYDDPTVDEVLALAGPGSGGLVRVLVDNRMLLSQYWNRCADIARGELLMQCGDDLVFHTPGWDATFTQAFDQYPDKIALVYGDDGLQHERIATHGVLHRRWVDTVGYFVPPHFASDYNDLWLTEVAAALGRLVYLPEVYTEHLHPAAGKATWDRTHQERLARHATEQVDHTWHTTAHLRARDVELLRAVMETPA
jgi:glycosyltransferase involved in cell wall biosynthesis